MHVLVVDVQLNQLAGPGDDPGLFQTFRAAERRWKGERKKTAAEEEEFGACGAVRIPMVGVRRGKKKKKSGHGGGRLEIE